MIKVTSIPLSRQQGFTLLEAIIVLVIMVTLFMASLPLMNSWNETLQTTNTHGLLKTAMNSARSTSQLNRLAKSDQESSAVLCAEDDRLFVREATRDDPASCTGAGNIVWQSDWARSSGIEIQTGGRWAELTCICLTASGLSTTDGVCINCYRPARVRVNIGGEYNEYIGI